MSGTDVKSLEEICEVIVETGAKICVIADERGLPLISKNDGNVYSDDLETALSALASIVLSTGESCAREMSGVFEHAIISTSRGDIITSLVPSDPRLLVVSLVDKELTSLLKHKIESLVPLINAGAKGIITTLKESYQIKTGSPQVAKIKAQFEYLRKVVNEAKSINEIIFALNKIKDLIPQIIGTWTVVGFEMNRAAIDLEKYQKAFSEPNLDAVKKEFLKKVQTWETRLLKQLQQ